MCSSYLAERHQESAEVSGGVAADGILQLLPVLWRPSVCGWGLKIYVFICISKLITQGTLQETHRDRCSVSHVKHDKSPLTTSEGWSEWTVLGSECKVGHTSFVDFVDFLNLCIGAGWKNLNQASFISSGTLETTGCTASQTDCLTQGP